MNQRFVLVWFLLAALSLPSTQALVPPATNQQRQQVASSILPTTPPGTTIRDQFRRTAAAGLLLVATTTATPLPVVADDTVVGTALEPAIVQMAQAAYPVMTSMSDLSPLTAKIATLIDKKIPVAKTVEALDKGMDSFLSIPNDKVTEFARVVQTAYDGVSGDSCQTIPGSTAAPLVSIMTAVQQLDASKVQALQTKFASANQAVPHQQQGGNLCLPASAQGLEQLWMGQTQLTLNIPKAAAKPFVQAASSAVASVPGPEFLKLLPDVKKTLISNGDAKAANKLEMAGKALEKALQSDARIQKRLNTN